VDPQTRFEQLYRTYGDRVHAYALRRSNSATADDVTAEVFLIAWRRLDHVPDEPFPWLLAVARRVLANRRRAEGRAAALNERLAGSYRPSEPAHVAVDERVFRALSVLRESDRELLLLTAWEGLGQAEVAEALALRRGTVAVRLHRARQRFAEALADQNDDVSTPMEVRR
jgi:RNA polymerase sigma-70 factor, ECF subfamily